MPPVLSKSLIGRFFLYFAVYMLLNIIAAWLSMLDIGRVSEIIMNLARYGGSIAAFDYIDRCDKYWKSVDLLVGNGIGYGIFWGFVLIFVSASIGIEKLADYTIAYLGR